MVLLLTSFPCTCVACFFNISLQIFPVFKGVFKVGNVTAADPPFKVELNSSQQNCLTLSLPPCPLPQMQAMFVFSIFLFSFYFWVSYLGWALLPPGIAKSQISHEAVCLYIPGISSSLCTCNVDVAHAHKCHRALRCLLTRNLRHLCTHTPVSASAKMPRGDSWRNCACTDIYRYIFILFFYKSWHRRFGRCYW